MTDRTHRADMRGETGQTLVVVALFMVVIIGMAALAIDVGRVLVARHELRASTDAAALAAAQFLPDTGTARTTAFAYSACTIGSAGCPGGGGKNIHSDLSDVTTTVTFKCRAELSNCNSMSDPNCSTTPCNAMVVREEADVPTFFGRLLGIDSMKAKATSTALMRGGVPHPLDVEVVVDTTGSMNTNCSSSVTGIPSGSATKLDCAKTGIRALLSGLWPCAQELASCGTPDPSGNVPNPVDRVGLLVFPPLVNDSAANLATRRAKEEDCADNLSSSSDVWYPSPVEYQVVPFSSDFRTSDNGPLQGDSNLVKTVWWWQCPGHVYPTGGGATSIGGGPSSTSNTSGARNRTIGGGPSSSSDRSGASNDSTIGGGPGSSGNRSGASSGSSGSIGAGVPNSGSSSNDRSTGQNSSGSSSIAINRPSTRVAGDFLLAAVTVKDLGTNNICAPSGSGWTSLRRDDSIGTSPARLTQEIFWKFAATASSDASTTFTFRTGACPSGGSTTAGRATAVMIRYTGVEPTDPIDVHSADTVTTAGTSLTAPAVTTTVDNDRVVNLYGIRGSTSGTTISGATFSFNNGSSSNNLAMAAEDFTQATAGLAPLGTATSNNSGLWVGQTVALKPASAGAASITISRPSNQADGDFLLVSVTARNLDGGSICAPGDGTWTLLRQDTEGPTGNSVTHTTFWSFRSGLTPEFYTFTFYSDSCGGSPTNVASSAVAVRYTGVDPVPIDVSASNRGNTGGGTTLTALAVNTTLDNDRVVYLYGARCPSMSSVASSTPGSGTATGVEDSTQATAGLSQSATATSCSNTDWVAHTVALRPAGAPSITINRPGNRANGDFLLVSVTARNLDGGSICAPGDGTWTLLRQDTEGTTGNSVTHASFWSFRSGTGAESYTFAFHNGSCGGPTVSAAASAVAVRYTGVEPTAPIDASAGGQGTDISPTAPAVTTTFDGDRVVRLYGTRWTSFSSGTTFSQPGIGTATGVSDATQATAGATSAATAGTSSSAPWVAHTVALRAAATSITIARPSTRANGDFLLVSVTAQNLDGATICPPGDGTWTLVRQDTRGSTPNSVTHATFWSFRSGTAAESYTFAFRSGSSCSGGSALGAAASAVAVRYTGVDPGAPIDVSDGNAGNDASLLAPSVTTTFDGDRIVRSYGTTATSLSSSSGNFFPQSGSATATGVQDTGGNQATAGATGTATATAGSSAPWVAHTIALKFVGTCSPCFYGLESGSNTYFTAAINAAQTELATNGRPNAQHVIIFLGDGEANTTVPPDTQWCHSPITASQNAQAAGTWVYSIAYDATGLSCTDSGAVTFASASSAANDPAGANTLVITKPSGVANNDVLVAGITVNGGTNTTVTPPSGWTLIRRTNNGTNVGLGTYRHVVTNAAAEPASYSWGLGGTVRASGGINRYIGVDTSNPIDVNGGGTGNSNTPQAPSVTTTTAGDQVVGFFGINTNATFTPPSGMSERYDQTNSSANGPATETADFTQASTGATGIQSATATASENWAAQLVALRPVQVTLSAVCIMHRIADPSSPCTDNASDPAKRFFNQPSDGDLTSIFGQLAIDLTTTRLLPD